MSTLAEIESAAAALPSREKAELLLFVASQLRAEGAPLPEPRLFSPEQIQAWMDEDEEDMRKFRAPCAISHPRKVGGCWRALA